MSRIARAVYAGLTAMILYPVLSGLISGWSFNPSDFILWSIGALVMAGVVYYLSGYQDPPPAH